MGSTSPSRRRALRGLGALALAPGSVWPAVGGLPSAAHDASSPEWRLLSERLFPGRQLIAGHGTVQLIAPLRAAYGASVPVKVLSMTDRPALDLGARPGGQCDGCDATQVDPERRRLLDAQGPAAHVPLSTCQRGRFVAV